MPKFLEKLKSLKHLNVDRGSEANDDVLQTPSDPSVKWAEALVEGRRSCSPTDLAGSGEGDVIQTPTSQAVRLAEADLGDSPDRRRTTSFVASLAERLSRGVSFHASHSDLHKLDLDAPPRARPLTFSKSQPNLKAAVSAATPPAGLVVLGKEERRRSRRYLQSEDGTPVSPHLPEASAASLPGRSVERSVASTSGVYRVLKPIRSPFENPPESGWQGPSTPCAALSEDTPESSSPNHAGRERRRISRKISSSKLVVSTDPLEAKPGEIMLCPEVAEFAPGALADLGGHYTGEIQFSGKSARMARRLSRRATMDPDGQQKPPVVGVTA
ncbi:hypothetical protein COCOBI_07-2730 [Coccomyxa sp. Obi]|nr:hypothetical protein COCOBI_07-2730 [Coccomyxa sp. Obi]